MRKVSGNGGYEAESHAATMTLYMVCMTVTKNKFLTTHTSTMKKEYSYPLNMMSHISCIEFTG